MVESKERVMRSNAECLPGKVLFLARWYPNESDPMPGLFIQRHAVVAASFAQTSVLYIHLNLSGAKGFRIVEAIEDKVFTVRVYYDPAGKCWLILRPLVAMLKFIWAWNKGYKYVIKRWGNPDVIHVNVLSRLGIIAFWKKLFNGIPYVITEHWSRYLPVTGTYKGLLRKWVTRLVVRKASALSTVSRNLANAMASHGLVNRKTIILPNVVDCEQFKPAINQQENRIKRMVHISCFQDHSKNISGILRTIKSLSEYRNDFECSMVGEGIDFDTLKLYASELGIEGSPVVFTGLLEGEELIGVLSSADFMIMFSNYENMPVVINEAFACGVPVIATRVGGIPEYVHDWNGLLVEPGDGNALAEAITHMLNHSQDFNRIRIRDFALSEFSNQAVSERLKEIYQLARKF